MTRARPIDGTGTLAPPPSTVVEPLAAPGGVRVQRGVSSQDRLEDAARGLVESTPPVERPWIDEAPVSVSSVLATYSGGPLSGAVLRAFAELEGDAPGTRLVAAVTASPAFSALAHDVQQRLLRILACGGFWSELARSTFRRVMELPASAEDLRTFVELHPHAPGPLWLPPEARDIPAVRRLVSYSEPGELVARFAFFGGGDGEAWSQTIRVDGRAIPVSGPKMLRTDDGLWRAPITDMIEALLRLRPELRAAIVGVTTNPDRSPEDTADRRAFMSVSRAGEVNVFPVSLPEPVRVLAAALIHEVGHLIANALFGVDAGAPSWQPWRDAMAADGIPPSAYARVSAAEDFCEALKLLEVARWSGQTDAARALVPARLALLERLLDTYDTVRDDPVLRRLEPAVQWAFTGALLNHAGDDVALAILQRTVLWDGFADLTADEQRDVIGRLAPRTAEAAAARTSLADRYAAGWSHGTALLRDWLAAR